MDIHFVGSLLLLLRLLAYMGGTNARNFILKFNDFIFFLPSCRAIQISMSPGNMLFLYTKQKYTHIKQVIIQFSRNRTREDNAPRSMYLIFDNLM